MGFHKETFSGAWLPLAPVRSAALGYRVLEMFWGEGLFCGWVCLERGVPGCMLQVLIWASACGSVGGFD